MWSGNVDWDHFPYPWNRMWVYSCSIRPSFRIEQDNQQLSDIDLSAYDILYHGKVTRWAEEAGPTTVWVPHAALKVFIEKIWPNFAPSRRIVLVSGLADAGPARSLGIATPQRWRGNGDWCNPTLQEPLHSFLADIRLVAWHSENLDFVHPKVQSLPLGFDFHTLAGAGAAEKAAWGPSSLPPDQAADLLRARQSALLIARQYREPTVFVHFGLVNRRRLAVMTAVVDSPCFTLGPGMAAKVYANNGLSSPPSPESPVLPRHALWGAMARHAWVASVEGYGLDCHRTWEALAMGCGVVVQDTPALRQLLEGAPALFVSGPPANWAVQVTRDTLRQTWAEWEARASAVTGGLEEEAPYLSAAHWLGRINTWRPRPMDSSRDGEAGESSSQVPGEE